MPVSVSLPSILPFGVSSGNAARMKYLVSDLFIVINGNNAVLSKIYGIYVNLRSMQMGHSFDFPRRVMRPVDG